MPPLCANLVPAVSGSICIAVALYGYIIVLPENPAAVNSAFMSGLLLKLCSAWLASSSVATGIVTSERAGQGYFRPCSVCGSPRLCRRRERRLVGARIGRWRE